MKPTRRDVLIGGTALAATALLPPEGVAQAEGSPSAVLIGGVAPAATTFLPEDSPQAFALADGTAEVPKEVRVLSDGVDPVLRVPPPRIDWGNTVFDQLEKQGVVFAQAHRLKPPVGLRGWQRDWFSVPTSYSAMQEEYSFHIPPFWIKCAPHVDHVTVDRTLQHAILAMGKALADNAGALREAYENHHGHRIGRVPVYLLMPVYTVPRIVYPRTDETHYMLSVEIGLAFHHLLPSGFEQRLKWPLQVPEGRRANSTSLSEVLGIGHNPHLG